MPESELEAIYLSPGHDFRERFGQDRLVHGIQSVAEVECRAGSGLVGDRYFDFRPDYKGQVTFFDAAVGEEVIAGFGPAASMDAFRRNLVVRDLDLNALIGRRFVFGGVEMEGVEECAPCSWMNQVIGPGALEALRGRGGLRARILTDGVLRLGPQSWQWL